MNRQDLKQLGIIAENILQSTFNDSDNPDEFEIFYMDIAETVGDFSSPYTGGSSQRAAEAIAGDISNYCNDSGIDKRELGERLKKRLEIDPGLEGDPGWLEECKKAIDLACR